MYHLNKQFLLYVVIVCWYLLVNSSIANARIVVVIYGGDTSITAHQACSMAVAEALLRETEEYLDYKFPEARGGAIKQYFSMIAPGLISNVTELEPTPLEDGRIKGIFDIPIRKKALYRLLRELGILYTTSSLQPYLLNVHTVSDETSFMDKLILLEQVTGVVRNDKFDNSSNKIELELNFKDGMWIAKLLGGSQPIQACGSSVDIIWREVWGEFFFQRQKEPISHLQNYLLEVSGWKHAAEIESLEKTLSRWESSIKNVLLHEISINKGTIVAQWALTILDMNRFEQQIRQYILARKLYYELSPVESIPTIHNATDLQSADN